MENEFDEVMRKRKDIDLIKILNGPPDDYQPVALEAARREFERRSLSDVQITTATQEIIQEQEVDEAKANAPLGAFWKILSFIFPGIILLMLAGIFKADGYKRKSKELVKWTLYGFGFYVGIIVLINVLRFVL
jgi:hypothetical protein